MNDTRRDDDLTAAVTRAAGLRSHERAEAALAAVAVTLGRMVPAHHREPLAALLEEPLASRVRTAEHDPRLGLDALLDAVEADEGVGRGAALEHAEATLGALRDLAERDGWRVFQAELPRDVAALIPSAPRPDIHPERPRGRPAEGGRHLSDGRPGSRRPLSEHPPPGGHPHSVASADDPHADTKLSEARGLTQERERGRGGR